MRILFAFPTWAFGFINGPLLFLNLIFNIFFAFCLIFPPHNGQRKQPLTTLLGALIFCTVVYCIFNTLTRFDLNSGHLHFIMIVVLHNVDYSMTSYVWLNFYYYLQIVPSRCAPIQWAKRNIKRTMYIILVIDGFITLTARLPFMIFQGKFLFNLTFPTNHQEVVIFGIISFYMILAHFLLNFAVMIVSSWSTVCYLHRHIKSVAKGGNSFFTAKLRGQLRITVTGICQAVLFFLYTAYYFFHALCELYCTDLRISTWIIFVITTLFMTGTTVTLGLGQSVFRKRIVNTFNLLKYTICYNAAGVIRFSKSGSG